MVMLYTKSKSTKKICLVKHPLPRQTNPLLCWLSSVKIINGKLLSSQVMNTSSNKRHEVCFLPATHEMHLKFLYLCESKTEETMAHSVSLHTRKVKTRAETLRESRGRTLVESLGGCDMHDPNHFPMHRVSFIARRLPQLEAHTASQANTQSARALRAERKRGDGAAGPVRARRWSLWTRFMHYWPGRAHCYWVVPGGGDFYIPFIYFTLHAYASEQFAPGRGEFAALCRAQPYSTQGYL